MLKQPTANGIQRILFFILLLICIQAPAQSTFVFFGSFNWDKNKEGIYVYELNTKSGQLTKVSSVTGVHNPSYLTVSPNGRFVYACTESKTANAGSVSSFQFDLQNRTLTFLNSQRSGGENPVYVNVHENGKWLVNANYTQGSVSVYPLLANGTIDSSAQNIQYTEGSINEGRQDRSHIHAAVFSPQQNYLFLPDLGADMIRSYAFNNDQKAPLHSKGFTSAVPGSGPRHFTFHPNGKYAYCIEELSGTISAYIYRNGALDSLQRIATHPAALLEGYESADIHLSPDGRFLYATNRGQENNIAIFSVRKDGRLKPVGYQSTFGNHPRTFAVDPSGQFLIVTNVVSENVVVFKRNRKTGLLKKVEQDIHITNVSCVKMQRY
ncbi:MAG TPA: lactonase family protein [Flavisolibacter sp.]|nr:lactonase family protein [Flavisolibacter sp.]